MNGARYFQGLFADQVQDDFSLVGADPVLEEVDALPRAQREMAVEDGNRKLHLSQGSFEVGRHVIRAFRVMLVGAVFRGDPVEVCLQVDAYGRVGVFLDQERRGGVPAEDRQEAGVDLLAGEPFLDGCGEVVKALAAGGEAKGLGGLLQGRSFYSKCFLNSMVQGAAKWRDDEGTLQVCV